MAFLVFLFSFFVLVSSENNKCKENTKWMRQQVLNSKGTVTINWDFDNENITMMMIGRTTGWVAVGFSPSGGMTGADIIMGWIKDGKPYLQDYYGEHNGRPFIDDIQSYEFLGGNENGTHTTICWTRKLNNCDQQDLKITNNTVHVIWALHNDDPADLSFEAPSYHGLDRGVKNLHLLAVVYQRPSVEDYKIFDASTLNLTIPNDTDTLYWCTPLLIPIMDKEYHMIGYEPHFESGNENLLHHFLLYECDTEINKDAFNFHRMRGYNCHDPKMLDVARHCISIRLVWTVGSEGEFYPPDVGFRFGSTKMESYYLLEAHYNIQDPKYFGIQDNSGIRVFYTDNLRKHEGGLFNIGLDFASPLALLIPPKQESFSVVGICGDSCLKEALPPDGIRVFSILLHAHYAGRQIHLRRFRNGVELEPIFDNFFDANYQQPVYLKEELLILPGDVLVAECVYDTNSSTNTILGGYSSTNEMCLVFLNYYPRFNINWCLSRMKKKAVVNLTGIVDLLENKNILTNGSSVNVNIIDYLHEYHWTKDKVEDLHRLYYNTDQESFCGQVNDAQFADEEEVVRFPSDEKKFHIQDQCQ